MTKHYLLFFPLLVAIAACSSAPSTDTGPTDGQTNEKVAQPYDPCGGVAGVQCVSGYVCVDNPCDTCDPKRGGSDCVGVCLASSACGGVIGAQCSTGFTCTDDPRDSCNPADGDVDCSGLCAPSCAAKSSH